jgi:hypothetical protein
MVDFESLLLEKLHYIDEESTNKSTVGRERLTGKAKDKIFADFIQNISTFYHLFVNAYDNL